MRTHAGIWAAVAAMLLTSAPVTASAAPGEDRGRGEEHRSARADAALDAARALFRPHADAEAQAGPRSRRTTAGAAPEHATLVLRDLALNLDALDPDDQKMARRILARPTEGVADYWQNGYAPDAPTAHTCSDTARICLHWVTDPEDPDAPDLTDTDGDAVPDWVEQNQLVFEEVWQRIVVELGYRRPTSDVGAADPGPDDRTDIYLAELGQFGMYGYCTMDSPAEKAAYCVVDDDFEDFVAPAAQSLRVTAAHEFFHAVQFAYSMRADSWVMEGTAAWVEDEVYDQINDNLQYLSHSALSCPGVSLDFVGTAADCRPRESYGWLYGSWLWWRFLTEYFGTPGEPDASVVRGVWQRLASGVGTLQAQRRVIAAHGARFPVVFADFGAANRVAHRWYDEGRSYAPYVGPAAGKFVLRRDRRDTGWMRTGLDHLSTKHALVRPGRGLRGKWRLRVDLDLPWRFRGSRATVLVHGRSGRIRWVRARLDRRGDARVVVGFNKRFVARVAISFTNASTRFADCRNVEPTSWTCGGDPKDDGLVFAFRARVVR